ncbi:MAG: Rrf2 family transcriptional regulator [Sedimentisphaerales bacterium]|nr:Rrf2 family transcriptional regulator [Sedimentisphaerales bacterium]
MDVVRRNTDYAARLMVHLAKHYGNGPMSTRAAAAEEEVPYQLACKLMQKLNNAKLVTSCMGPKGGFVLGAEPSKITLLDVVEAIQGPISINRCVLDKNACSRSKICAVREKLADIQENLTKGLAAITLDELKQGAKQRRKQ